MSEKCLYCYQELKEGQRDYHPACARRFFGSATPPVLPYSRQNISELASEVIRSRTTLTGVQPKLSMDINRGGRDEPDRLTIVGLWGRYILKPKSDTYPWLPEDEDLTMHLATLARIQVVPHALIRFSDGELTYITRRIDRDDDGRKYLMEDACQLSERLSADKYKSSYENVGKLIRRYSSMAQLDLVNYWELVVFSWLTGNSDMHLKNFSLLSLVPGLYTLAPAYDLLNVHLLFDDPEELALTLDGRKRKLTRQNFVNAMRTTGLDDKVIGNILQKFQKVQPRWEAFIDQSFLPEELRERYKAEISQRLAVLTSEK
ncbi:MAG: HipA domain-containing protein [Prevotella sp.]|jgi:serine/threonine-protein kinase HipA|nr:HipA domain-containing protein [Prevotella sp.]